MTTTLADGTVLPHYLELNQVGAIQDDGAFSNLAFRFGEIRDIIYPGDARSRTKNRIEYMVEVQHRDGNGPGTTSTYTHCGVSNGFGGKADKSRWTRRAGKAEKGQAGLGKGSKVLLLCINGETNNAIIIGGLDDEADEEGDSKDLGHHGFWEFNGIRADVNKDGELTVTFKGPTNADGALADGATSSDSGTTLQLLKDGSAVVAHDGQEVRIDHHGKQIQVKADSNVTIKSAGVLVGNATDQTALFSTYRSAESTKHQTMEGQLTSIATSIGIAGGALTSASALHVIPVAGPIIASPLLATAGASLTSLAPMFAALQAALITFEAQSLTYLSTKNKND